MSTHKHIDKICLVAALLAVVLCALFMNGENLGIEQTTKAMGYETRLFDTSQVHTVDIVMDNWDSFLETCENEEYAACSVVVDGEAYHNVGIRAKGNTSLSNVSSMDSDRYSFKIEFDQYDSTKSYHGLDKLSLNNLIQDSTMMKDYLTYQLMGQFGVAAPLCSYVYITVNGEDWGLYLAVEGVEDSFLQRNYGSDYGALYKPDSMNLGGGRGNGRDFNMEDIANGQTTEGADKFSSAAAEDAAFPELPEDFDPSAMFAGGQGAPGTMGEQPGSVSASETSSENTVIPEGERPGNKGGGMGSEETKLQYIDDNPDSYSAIFSSAKTNITQADQTRLIESLKTLGAGETIETAVDIDQVLRYFVVHNFVVNGDSYTGSMIHNYYLYEEDGKLAMIPWDYNLAFGTFQGRDASSAVNDPIDTPLSVTGSGDRPMADWIFSNEEYTQMYHQYFAQFLESTDFAAIIEETAALIAPYVERDPSKFYSTEEFQTGIAALKEFCLLREESVAGQLNGTIPSTSSGQAEDGAALVDAAHVNLSDMGSMNMGGAMAEGRPGSQKDQMGAGMPQRPGAAEATGGASAAVPNPDSSMVLPESNGSTEAPAEMKQPNAAGGRFPGSKGESLTMPDGVNPADQPEQNQSTMLLLAVSAAVLVFGLAAAKRYRH